MIVRVPTLIPVAVALIANLTLIVVEFARPKFVTDWHVSVGMPLSARPVLIVVRLLAIAGLIGGLWLPLLGLVSAFVLLSVWSLWSGRHRKTRERGGTFWLIFAMGLPTLIAGIGFITAWFATR